MRFGKKAVLVFGCGELQQSIIGRAHKMGLYVVGIDPYEDAYCKDDVDAFEVVGGQDYEGTCAVVERHGIDAIVTAATDKPLVMMARIAEKYGFPFFSVDTARWSTDKFLMKERFELGGIPHARGRLISRAEEAEDLVFPVIVKPRDNSGSRGVKLCRNIKDLRVSITEALENSHMNTVLVEEYIEGPEYSIEGLHFDGKSEVIQFTEKKTTEFPYNVELRHIQPADISENNKQKICELVTRVGYALGFVNCPSHTEVKINERGIFVIETSPRLGGDYITSSLVPLSTGINMEDQLLNISFGKPVDVKSGVVKKASGVVFFNFPEGRVRSINKSILGSVSNRPDVIFVDLQLSEGDRVPIITNSLSRYGEVVVVATEKSSLLIELSSVVNQIQKSVIVDYGKQ